MRNPRFYEPQPLAENTYIELSDDAVQHIRVLRLSIGDQISLFNGQGGQYLAQLSEVQKRHCQAKIISFQETHNESPLHLHLGQVISRGDRMEFVIQKAVELGVNEITPLISERCGVKLNAERMAKKQQQWQKIAIAACEQSGRNLVPTIHPTQTLVEWSEIDIDCCKLTLHPRAKYSINTLPSDINHVRLLIGPEGGLSDDEITLTESLNFTETLLGPRVLRTETAALTALTALQCRFGDLA
ncbi:16S rRNA (uracil(1498)-N(3))-methyltransferase [Psychromonas sp. RZ22]|uniref:16S rRNA (uracil(1498)-N(3))-methyltransferase n=1 Tax=Psychromonas algarum TaxID=2555643 RepID=UPI001067EF1E|nr:16S rRNA (uracil(1498)-N(3))-methyltransferase [Psychromonas sp. RZ22]TEW53631.1 16S rRNA (uracil(1498)-N(3))-methyltransferase [Psychromonas sp. RZ22]